LLIAGFNFFYKNSGLYLTFMHRILQLIISVIFFQQTIAAQDTIMKYLDKNFEITPSIENAAFVANIVKTGNSYFAKVFYGRENIALEGYYADKNLRQRNGFFKFYYASTSRIMQTGSFFYNYPVAVWERWYENGRKQDSGKKYYGKEVGEWKYWHENGQIKAIGKYADSIDTPNGFIKGLSKEKKANAISEYINSFFGDIRNGLWKTYFSNSQLRDSISYQEGLREGIAASWFENGNLECNGLYKNDKEEDSWNWFYPNGNPATVEIYRKGIIQKLQCFDSTGTPRGEFCSINKPAMFTGGNAALEKYIKDNIHYPEEALKNQLQPTISVQFTINPRGLPENINIGTSPSVFFNKEIERLLYGMPPWEPAVYHNRIVGSVFNMEMAFELPDKKK
jgi:antitoxin component YwqK of YwqJK toxin-antitoxin module